MVTGGGLRPRRPARSESGSSGRSPPLRKGKREEPWMLVLCPMWLYYVVVLAQRGKRGRGATTDHRVTDTDLEGDLQPIGPRAFRGGARDDGALDGEGDAVVVLCCVCCVWFDGCVRALMVVL